MKPVIGITGNISLLSSAQPFNVNYSPLGFSKAIEKVGGSPIILPIMDTDNAEELISIVDNYIVDIKDMNNDIYQRYTGKGNERVLCNLRYLIGEGKAGKIIIRTPLIPSYNTEKDVGYSIELLEEMGITRFDRFTYKTPND